MTQASKRSLSYYYISDTPSEALPNINKKNVKDLKNILIRNNSYFFIDLASDCNLHRLQKSKDLDITSYLALQKFGKNVLLNLEDSSVHNKRLVKFQQDQLEHLDKKTIIKRKFKNSLEKISARSRNHSSLIKKYELIQQYKKPSMRTQEQKQIKAIHQIEKTKQRQIKQMKKLGLDYYHLLYN